MSKARDQDIGMPTIDTRVVEVDNFTEVTTVLEEGTTQTEKTTELLKEAEVVARESLDQEEEIYETLKKGTLITRSITQTKLLVGGANSAFDILSESISAGTDWVFDFGGIGKIVGASIVISTTALTAETSLHLFDKALTCVLDDNVANTSPVVADIPNRVRAIEFPALRDYGTASLSYSDVALSTPGGLPIYFSTNILHAVLISVDAMTPGNVLCTITLTAEMES